MAVEESHQLQAYLDGTPCRVESLDLHGAVLVPESPAPRPANGRCRLQLALPMPGGSLPAETGCPCEPAGHGVRARFDRPGESFIQRLGFYLAKAEP